MLSRECNVTVPKLYCFYPFYRKSSHLIITEPQHCLQTDNVVAAGLLTNTTLHQLEFHVFLLFSFVAIPFPPINLTTKELRSGFEGSKQRHSKKQWKYQVLVNSE